MTCPECPETFPDDQMGMWTCGQCKTELVRGAYEDEPRIRPRAVKPTPPKIVMVDRSYPITVDENGSAFYSCVGCGDPIPVWDRMTKTVTYKDRVEVKLDKGKVLVGFKPQVPAVEHGPDWSIKSKAWPVFVTGPVCGRCERGN